MTFANPSYLWALLGLAIPIAIHLLSRKEGKVIRVGSIRHVEESNTSQFKSIRLNEILLLLLRMMMIVALAFFMSGAQCSGVDPKKKLVYAESGINVDSLVNKGYEFHEIQEESYWTFAEKLNKSPFETIVVSYSHINQFKGQRISLNENVKWITADSQPSDFESLAWKIGDSVFVRRGRSNEQVTLYSTEIKVPDSVKIIEPHPVIIKSDDKIVLAALNVLKKQYRLPIATNQQPTTNNQQPTTTIEVSPGIGPLVERISPTGIRINKNLDQDVAINDNLVIELFKVLYPELQPKHRDSRVLPDQFEFYEGPQMSLSSTHHLVLSGIEKYLMALFILALAAERFVAIRRNQ